MNNKYVLAASTALFFSTCEGTELSREGKLDDSDTARHTPVFINNPNMRRSRTTVDGDIPNTEIGRTATLGVVKSKKKSDRPLIRTTITSKIQAPGTLPHFKQIDEHHLEITINDSVYSIDSTIPSDFATTFTDFVWKTKNYAYGVYMLNQSPKEYIEAAAKHIYNLRSIDSSAKYELFYRLNLRWNEPISGKGWCALFLSYYKYSPEKLTNVLTDSKLAEDRMKLFGTSECSEIEQLILHAVPPTDEGKRKRMHLVNCGAFGRCFAKLKFGPTASLVTDEKDSTEKE